MRQWIGAAMLGVTIFGTIACAQAVYRAVRGIVLPQQVAGETIAVNVVKGETYTNAVYGFSILVPDGFAMHQQGRNFTMQQTHGDAASVTITDGALETVIAQQLQGVVTVDRQAQTISGKSGIAVQFTRNQQKFNAQFVVHRGAVYCLMVPLAQEDVARAV